MSRALIEISRSLSDQVGRLSFGPPVANWYNPLDYAWSVHRQYLERFGTGTGRVLLLGMNPGPFGMAQTGVPFGAVPAVRDWMKLDGSQIGQPNNPHPKRPVDGFACRREEPSGKRLWGMFQNYFPNAADCFSHFFVANYCPLVFMTASGANLTPNNLPAAVATELPAICQTALQAMIQVLKPRALVGVGAWAHRQLTDLATGLPTCRLPHPSPANPQANRNWAGQAVAALQQAQLWPI